MKSLIATAFLCSQSHASLEETFLMQGLVVRRGPRRCAVSTGTFPGAAPPHPSLADPWNWHLSEHYEIFIVLNHQTSQFEHMYPEVELGPAVVEFRIFSVEYFRYVLH